MKNKLTEETKILVVDDDENILFAFKELLRGEGMNCIEAKNGREALEKFAKEKPHVTFIDINLPRLNGLETLKLLIGWNPQAKIIITSADGFDQTIKKAIELGAFDYLIKPMSLTTIRKAIERALLDSKS